MASSNNRRVFNLLKPHNPPLTGWDRLYDWLLGKARVIMIIAEVVVAVTFIGKVVIDTQARALDEEIQRKNFELTQYAIQIEPTLRQIQTKVSVYKTLWNNSSSYAGVLAEIQSYIPNPGADLLISINNGEVIITGSDNYDNLQQIENRMKNSATFTDVELTNLNADTASEVEAEYQLDGTIANPYSRTSLGVIEEF